MRMAAFLRRLSTDLDRFGIDLSGAAVVAAVSGGADSLAMLHGLVALDRRRRLGLRLTVAHFDHRLRPESAAEADLVARQAEALGLDSQVGSADVAGAARCGSIEQTARRLRYRWLGQVCRRTDSRFLAVAHHADYQAETILHRICRGTSLRGLVGMAPRRPLDADGTVEVIRPLLGFRRSELVALVESLGQTYCCDPSNDRLDATRNRIRHQVLPLLDTAVHPGAASALVRLGQQAAAAQRVVADAADAARRHLDVRTDDGRTSLDAAALTALPELIGGEVVRRLLADFGAGEARITAAHLQRVLRLAAAAHGRKTLHLPRGLRAARRGPRLMLWPER